MQFSFGDEEEFEQYIFGFKPSKSLKASLWAHTLSELKKFNKEHSTDEHCVEGIYCRMSPFVCAYCGGEEFIREFGGRKGRCAKCNKQKRFTAQSPFFNGMKSPRAYLGMIYLIEKGCFFNAHQVTGELKISRGSSWELLREIEMAIYEAISAEGEVRDLDSAMFLAIFTRRSSVTPAYEEPYTEQAAMEKMAEQTSHHEPDSSEFSSGFPSGNSPNSFSDRSSEAFTENASAEFADLSHLSHLSAFQQKLYLLIGSEAVSLDSLLAALNVSVSEVLSALTVLELEGLIVCLPGQKFKRAAASAGTSLVVLKNSVKKPSTHTNELVPGSNFSAAEEDKLQALVQSFFAFIRVLSQGASRKYIQLYFSRFCFLMMGKLKGKPFPLFDACDNLGEIGRAEVKGFISSLKIKFAASLL